MQVGLRDRVDVDHLLKFWVVFGGILFIKKGNTNFSSYPNILLLDIVTGDLTDDFLSKTHKFYNFATQAFFFHKVVIKCE